MKNILLIGLLLLSLGASSQVLYVPTKPDSIRVAAQVNGVVRSIYVVDLFKSRVSLAKHTFDSTLLRGLIPVNNNQLTNGAGYLTSAALATYLLSATAATTYVRKDSAAQYTLSNSRNNDLLKYDSVGKGFVNFRPTFLAPLIWDYTIGQASADTSSSGTGLVTKGFLASQGYGSGGGASGWPLTGAAGTNSGTNYIGTSDNHSLVLKTNKITALKIDSVNQHIGIGTNPTSNQLEVTGFISSDYLNVNTVMQGSARLQLGGTGKFNNGSYPLLIGTSPDIAGLNWDIPTQNVVVSANQAVEFNGKRITGADFNTGDVSNTNALSRIVPSMNYTSGTSWFNHFKVVMSGNGNATGTATGYMRAFYVQDGTITQNNSTLIAIPFENQSGTNLFNSTSGATIIGGSYADNVANRIFNVKGTKTSHPFPSMTQANRLAITMTSANYGDHVYQTDGTEGVYVYKSTGWVLAY